MIDYKNQRVGVFIDVQNMYYTARNLYNRKVNFGNIVKASVGERQLIRAIAYVVSTKTGENQPFFDALANIGIETKEKELMEYYGGQKKADWDVGITVDAIRMSESLDVIVLVSGDGDYIPLVEYLKSRGKIVEVVSFRETTSTKLFEEIGAEHYTNLSENKRGFLIGSRTASKKPGATDASKSKDISNIIDGHEKIDTEPSANANTKANVTTPSAASKARKSPSPTRTKTTATKKAPSANKSAAPASKKPLRRRARPTKKDSASSTKHKGSDDSGLSANERALKN
ncbi:NYN domain-containing protein [Candidatus Uhrbacteria bacterium]|nr:NYN domain-containing protein [Candidatus Uhrbacteria bacterium]